MGNSILSNSNNKIIIQSEICANSPVKTKKILNQFKNNKKYFKSIVKFGSKNKQEMVINPKLSMNNLNEDTLKSIIRNALKNVPDNFQESSL